MNKTDNSLVDAAAPALRDLGFEVRVDRKHDGVSLTLERDRKMIRYRVEVKRDLRPAVLGPIVHAFSKEPDDRLLISDYVTPPVADELRRRNIEFVDAAGNVFLNKRGLLVFISGRRAHIRRMAPKTPRVFRPTGIRIVFALLAVPDLVRAPQREIARAAGVALGSVAIVFEGLRDLGFVAEIDGTRRLLRSDRLLDQWTEAYVRLLHPTLDFGHFSAPARNWWRKVDINRYGAQWGGETAAAILQRQLVPEQNLIYADKMPPRLVSEHRLKAGGEGRIVVRRRFWHFDHERTRRDVTPPLLIYADLVAAGDARSLDAARRIRDEYLG